MPTLSFILEGDQDRLYGGTTTMPADRPEHVPNHPCSFYHARFAEPVALSDHLALAHVGRRLFLHMAKANNRLPLIGWVRNRQVSNDAGGGERTSTIDAAIAGNAPTTG